MSTIQRIQTLALSPGTTVTTGIRTALICALAILCVVGATLSAPASDSEDRALIVGTWHHSILPDLTFNRDGTGKSAGVPATWKISDGRLTIITEVAGQASVQKYDFTVSQEKLRLVAVDSSKTFNPSYTYTRK